MADQNTPPVEGAPDTQDEQDPFTGFNNEVYDDGELVTADDAAEEEDADGADEDEDDANAENDADEADDAEDDDSEEDEEKPAPPKQKKGARERINELTKARREAERRAAELEQRLQALENAKQRAKPEAEADAADDDDSDEPQPPKPEDFEYGELDSRYIAAVAKYHTDQRWAELEQQREQKAAQARQLEEQRTVQEKFQAKIEAGSKKYDDFDDLVVGGAERNEWALSPEMAHLLVESDVGDDIAYYLASHPEESVLVSRQSPLEQARYFGKLEASFSAAQSAATGKTGKTAKTRTPQAPPPVPPARGAGGQFQASAKSSDFASFERVANQTEK